MTSVAMRCRGGREPSQPHNRGVTCRVHMPGRREDKRIQSSRLHPSPSIRNFQACLAPRNTLGRVKSVLSLPALARRGLDMSSGTLHNVLTVLTVGNSSARGLCDFETHPTWGVPPLIGTLPSNRVLVDRRRTIVERMMVDRGGGGQVHPWGNRSWIFTVRGMRMRDWWSWSGNGVDRLGDPSNKTG